MTKYEVKIQGTYDYQFTTTSKNDVVTILQAIVDRLVECDIDINDIDFDPNELYSSWWLLDENHPDMFGGIYVQFNTTDINIDEIVNTVV